MPDYPLLGWVEPDKKRTFQFSVNRGAKRSLDFLGHRSLRAGVAMFAGMALAMGVWALSTQAWQLGTFAIVYGLFYGGWVALLPAVVMDEFGGRNVSGIIGILYTSVAFGTLVGPSAAGFAFDLTQSYTLPIVASVCANIASTCIIAVAYRSRMNRVRISSGGAGARNVGSDLQQQQ